MHILRKVKPENGYGFLRPGLKTGVENDIFWSEIGSGFGDAGGTPPAKIPRSSPPPPPPPPPREITKQRNHFSPCC